jgi:phosphate transport system permease protein
METGRDRPPFTAGMSSDLPCRPGTRADPAPEIDRLEGKDVSTNSLKASTSSLKAPADRGRAGDKIFSGISLAAGILILAVLFSVAVFLLVQAAPIFTADPTEVTGGNGFAPYILPIVIGTVIAAAIALLIATPIGIAVALFISHYAPRRLARTM